MCDCVYRFDFIVVLASFVSLLLQLTGFGFSSVMVLPLFRVLRSVLLLIAQMTTDTGYITFRITYNRWTVNIQQNCYSVWNNFG